MQEIGLTNMNLDDAVAIPSPQYNSQGVSDYFRPFPDIKKLEQIIKKGKKK